ncbi:LTA synthase family protein [Lapidilactobacillus mulanensis]|nr:LTA synthase family protein [Lapidilactobacillus mulanensis]
MISYFLTIFVFFTMYVPLFSVLRRNNLSEINTVFKMILNAVSVFTIVLVVSRYILRTNLLIATNYSLMYFARILTLFLLTEIIILLLDNFFHLGNFFTIIEIRKSTLKKTIQSILLSLLVAVAVFLYKASFWATNTFGLLNPEQLIYNLQQPMEGADTSFIASFLNGPLLVAVICLLLVFPFVLALFRIRFEIHNRFKYIYTVVTVICLAFSSVLIFAAAKNINIAGFYKYFTSSSTFIERNYVDPQKTKLTFPTKKRNLIYIYVESLESTSIDKLQGGQMSTNLLSKLTELSSEGIHFSDSDKKFGGAMQFYGTGWTIAGMVAQTAGLPLKVPVQGNSYANSSKQEFLPGATTINDILKENGYQQTILMGSDATFGGRRSYFTQHGNIKIDDYLQAKKDKRIAPDYRVWWGYEDSKLFAYAKQDLIKMAAKGKPFNFTMLTANTHHIGGFPEKNMPKTYPQQYSNVISFTDTQLVEFVSWIKTQPFYDNTTIIINGDHLSMDAKYYQDIPSKKRHTFNLILNAAGDNSNVKEKNRTFGTFDMFPTTLAALGVKIEGNRLGLGTNLLSAKKTIAEKYGFKVVNEELSQSSKFYNDTFMYSSK